jgi:hypothetical protein
MKYISDEKLNTEFQGYISRNIPIGQLIEIDGFKIGGDEASTQVDCLVSLSNPFNPRPSSKGSKNQFVNVAWLALLFEESIKLRNEKNEFITRLQDLVDSNLTYGEKFEAIKKELKSEPFR